MGSTAVAQTMNSGISAYLGGKLGLGNQVTTNSSACTTGTESILMGFEASNKEKQNECWSEAQAILDPIFGVDLMR